MINAVIGDVVFTNGQTLVLRAGAVEYSLVVSAQTALNVSRLEGAERRNVRILTYLQHREDEMVLFGFSSEQERQLFLELIKVSGIGARGALKILSGASVSDIIAALDREDVKFLSKIPGLGTKTAQKIILALRDTLVAGSSATGAGSAPQAARKYDDLVAALSDMGYDKKRVVDVIAGLEQTHAAELGTKSLQEQEEILFRLALSTL